MRGAEELDLEDVRGHRLPDRRVHHDLHRADLHLRFESVDQQRRADRRAELDIRRWPDRVQRPGAEPYLSAARHLQRHARDPRHRLRQRARRHHEAGDRHGAAAEPGAVAQFTVILRQSDLYARRQQLDRRRRHRVVCLGPEPVSNGSATGVDRDDDVSARRRAQRHAHRQGRARGSRAASPSSSTLASPWTRPPWRRFTCVVQQPHVHRSTHRRSTDDKSIGRMPGTSTSFRAARRRGDR